MEMASGWLICILFACYTVVFNANLNVSVDLYKCIFDYRFKLRFFVLLYAQDWGYSILVILSI